MDGLWLRENRDIAINDIKKKTLTFESSGSEDVCYKK